MVESVALAEVAQKERPRNPGWDNIKPAQKGEVRNPRGRPLGARTKLAEAYLADLYEAWQTDGPHAIAETVKRKPWEFVKIVSALMPQKVEVTNRFASMEDAELANAIARTIRELGPVLEGRVIAGPPGRQKADGSYEAVPVQALPKAD